ncbi:UDP-galactose-lipid carrier transferase [Leptospira sp. 96542]|nr:UDP-galactose-lipid carrier transferase [Leptospira sp. 96542]
MKPIYINKRPLKFSELDMNQTLDYQTYKDKMNGLQEKLRFLVFEANTQKRPILIVFEGWDAAGKGGSIRRLTQDIDPRLYEVHNIAAPTAEEKAHNYLWRFWNRIPKRGHLGILDRSHYGRVLVERVEGFATQDEWSRAYSEICLFEEQLHAFGTIIIKFWLHISKEEQLVRFDARKNDPLKRWKLTEEDYRNREKWALYEKAAEEMFLRTDRPIAPWILIQANDKYFTRKTVLETTVNLLEKNLKK